MRNSYIAFLSIVLTSLTLLLQGCGPKAFTKGGYDDPNKVILLDDKFGENDLQVISRDLVASMMTADAIQKAPKAPVVMVGKVVNKTSEHIDVKSLTNKIRADLVRSRKVRFSDKEVRDQLAEEYEYQAGKYVNKSQAKGPGKQLGIDYLVTGDIASNVQEVGNDKVVDYNVTLNLINLETNEVEWTDFKEVRKRYRKQSVGW